MPTLLTINASPRGEMSISRRLGDNTISHVHRVLSPSGAIAVNCREFGRSARLG
jgi:FMN-dependent NADH-azoreductase